MTLLTILHFKSVLDVVSPPACKPLTISFNSLGPLDLSVSLMNKYAADGSWAGIHILIVAPDREINTPVMQVKLDIPYRMSQVPANHDPF